MTGPEAIAAAERLLNDVDAKMMQTSADLDACRLLAVSAQVVRGLRAALLQSQAELYNHVACMVTEDSLRERAEVAEEALLQSQEALQRYESAMQIWIDYIHGRKGLTLNDVGRVISEIEAVLLSPPVAPKER